MIHATHTGAQAGAVRPLPGGRVYNFSAGPAGMPLEVLEQLRSDLIDLERGGAGILEISHRGTLFEKVLAQSEAAFRKVGNIPDDYAVLFLPGGATQQFGMLPMNFLPDGGSADYPDTGVWASKAIADAKLVGRVNEIWKGKECGYRRTPRPGELKTTPGSTYLHYCSNNTVYGTRWVAPPKPAAGAWLARDASSDIYAEPLDLTGCSFLYASAQKNLGPSGMTMVVMHRDLVKAPVRTLPSMMRYDEHVHAASRLNTPPTFGIHAVGVMCEWILRQGGLAEMARRSRTRCDLVMRAIKDSKGFWIANAEPECQSLVNVLFHAADPKHEAAFLEEAAGAGLDALAGHRATGGMRASMYNAMPVAGAKALADLMVDFARRHG
ncbi:MAG: 3-phosphoserine/phosphohydroxythreonine transaminase [Planctomycetes bacterium]|nr:3-phosphoserine/phosphohydroxythreonine transaminase [Planctomycetota bacterium]